MNSLVSIRGWIAACLIAAAVLPACTGKGSAGAGPLLIPPFANATGEARLAPLAHWLSDMVARDLAQEEPLSVCTPLRSADFERRHQGVGRPALLEAAAAEGAGRILLGRLALDPGGYLISAELVTVPGGEPLAEAQARAPDAEGLPAAVEALRDDLLGQIGVRRSRESRSIAAITTASVPAYGHYIEGMHHYVHGRYLAAQESFGKAVDVDLGFALAHHARVLARLQHVPIPSTEDKSFITLAVTHKDRAGPADLLAMQALNAMLFGKAHDAANAFTEARRRWPEDRDLAYYHAIVLGELKRDPEALAAYAAAAAVAPDFVPALEGVANRAFVAGDRDRAARAFATARQVNPGDPRLIEGTVLLDLYAGRLDEAARLLEAALQVRQDPEVLVMKGNLMLLEGRPVEALEQFLAARSPFPASLAEAYNGRIYAAINRLDSASKLQAAAGNPLPASVGLWFMGMLMDRNGDRDIARDVLNRAAQISPEFAAARASLGVQHAERGEMDKARKSLEMLRQHPPIEVGGERHALRLEAVIEMLAPGGDGAARAIPLLEKAKSMAGPRFLGGGYISDAPLFAETLASAYRLAGQDEAAQGQLREIATMSGERLPWPWIWLEAQVGLAEAAAARGDVEEAKLRAGIVRQYWGDAGGQRQPLVDAALARIRQAVPDAMARLAAPLASSRPW